MENQTSAVIDKKIFLGLLKTSKKLEITMEEAVAKYLVNLLEKKHPKGEKKTFDSLERYCIYLLKGEGVDFASFFKKCMDSYSYLELMADTELEDQEKNFYSKKDFYESLKANKKVMRRFEEQAYEMWKEFLEDYQGTKGKEALKKILGIKKRDDELWETHEDRRVGYFKYFKKYLAKLPKEFFIDVMPLGSDSED